MIKWVIGSLVKYRIDRLFNFIINTGRLLVVDFSSFILSFQETRPEMFQLMSYSVKGDIFVSLLFFSLLYFSFSIDCILPYSIFDCFYISNEASLLSIDG